jgi:hypothetical protein
MLSRSVPGEFSVWCETQSLLLQRGRSLLGRIRTRPSAHGSVNNEASRAHHAAQIVSSLQSSAAPLPFWAISQFKVCDLHPLASVCSANSAAVAN